MRLETLANKIEFTVDNVDDLPSLYQELSRLDLSNSPTIAKVYELLATRERGYGRA